MNFAVSKKILYLYLILLFLLNIIQANTFELSYDESYYWVYSKFLSWGYYDHPPMVAWMIKLGTILGNGEVFVRLFFNILGVASLYLAWLMSNQKNIILFILISSSLPLIQASGFLALPDTGLLFFSGLFLYFVKDYIKNDSLKNILGLSITIPLMFYSKYHGLAVVIFTTLAYPKFVRRKSFWFIVLSTIILYSPHIYWQYTQDFITFKFHLFGRGQKVFDYKNILNYVSSQIALFGFFNFILMALLAKKINMKNSWERILSFNVFGFLLVLLFVSLRNQIEANWTVTSCLAAIPLIMILVEKRIHFKKYFYWSSTFALLFILVLRVLLMLPYSFYQGKKINRLNEVKGWKKRVERINEITSGHKLISDTYQVASKLSYYSGKIIPALHLTSRDSHFSLLKNLISEVKGDEEIYFLTPKSNMEGAIRVDTGYKDPIFLYKTTLNKLAIKFKLDYGKLLLFEPKF